MNRSNLPEASSPYTAGRNLLGLQSAGGKGRPLRSEKPLLMKGSTEVFSARAPWRSLVKGGFPEKGQRRRLFLASGGIGQRERGGGPNGR